MRTKLLKSDLRFFLLFIVLGILLWKPSYSPSSEQKDVKSILVIRPEQVNTYLAENGLVAAKMLYSEKNFYLGLLTMKPESKAASHQHDQETEIIYCFKGEGAFTCDGKDFKIGSGMLAVIPPKTDHSFRVTSPFKNVEALQLWIPGGPEKKYLSWKELY